MSDQLVKQVQQAGTSITKDKLLEMIKKSPAKQFSYSLSHSNTKEIVVLVAG